MLVPSLVPSLAALRVVAAVDAPTEKKQRKATATKTEDSLKRYGHHGLAKDSSAALSLIVLSRIVQATDEDIVHNAARTPTGAAVLAATRAMVLRVVNSTPASGVAPGFSAQSVTTLMAMSGSTIKAARLYNGGLSLPSLLPHAKADALVGALLDSVSAARLTELGIRLSAVLLQLPAPALVASGQADVDSFVEAVEEEFRRRVGGGGSTSSAAGGSTSGAAASTSSPSPPPSVVDLPTPVPVAVAAEPFAIDPTASLMQNVERLVRAKLGPLDSTQRSALADALDTSLSVLQAGDAVVRLSLLNANVLQALANASAALLWASCVEASEADGGYADVAAFGNKVASMGSSISSAVFAEAFGF